MNTKLAAPVRFSTRLVAAVFTLVAGCALAATPAAEAPPHHPDAVHVYNGCHLSALAYLAQFNSEFPSESGRTVIIRPINADGRRHPHTMALVTWQGEWWCRDEYFGEFALGCPAGTEPSLERIENRYTRHVQSRLHDSKFTFPTTVPPHLTAAQRTRAVETATTVIPYAHRVYWVRHGQEKVPLVFFRPAPGQIAVYDPMNGTGVANCASLDDTRVVAAVATQMGYQVDQLRAESNGARPAFITAANTNLGGSVR